MNLFFEINLELRNSGNECVVVVAGTEAALSAERIHPSLTLLLCLPLNKS